MGLVFVGGEDFTSGGGDFELVFPELFWKLEGNVPSVPGFPRRSSVARHGQDRSTLEPSGLVFNMARHPMESFI
jgi:hypothetical protein